MKKIIVSGALTVAALGGAIGFASAAGAQSAKCAMNISGSCGAQVNVSNNALTIKGMPSAGGTNAVTASPLNTATTQDFNAVQTTSNPNERVFFYAPNGVSTKFVLANTNGRQVALRSFNAKSLFQRWTGVNTQNTSGTQWTNNSSGAKLQANGTGNRVIALPNPSNVNGSFWGFQSAAVIPAS